MCKHENNIEILQIQMGEGQNCYTEKPPKP